MKRCLKIFLCILLCMFIMVAPISYAEQTAQSTLTYTCEDSYFIYIPENIVVGDTAEITASEVNISQGKSIYVDLMSINDYVEIYNDTDNSYSLNVRFKTQEGNDVLVMNPTIACFSSNSSSATRSFSTYIEDTTGAPAGSYSGTVMFNIRCE